MSKKFWKIAGIVFGCIALLLIAPPLLVWLVNSFDEPLTPATQAWLAPQARTVADADNGYLDLVAQDAQVAEPLTAAASAVHAYLALDRDPRNHDMANPNDPFAAVRQRLLKPSGTRLDPLLQCPKGKNTCYGWFLRNRVQLQALAVKYKAPLTRYELMLNKPAFQELTGFSPNYPVINSLYVTDLNTLYLSEMVFLAEDGHDEQACQRWATYQSFWQRMEGGSVSMLDVMLSVAAQGSGLRVLEDLRHDHPQSLTMQIRNALPVLQQSPSATGQFKRVVVFLFLREANQLSQVPLQSNKATSLSVKLPFHFFKLNATLNMVQQLRAEWLAHHGFGPATVGADTAFAVCDNPVQLRYLYNPVGKFLGCMGRNNYDQYFEKVARLQDMIQTQRKVLNSPPAVPEVNTAPPL